MKNKIDSNFAIAILALVAACVGFSFWFAFSAHETFLDEVVPVNGSLDARNENDSVGGEVSVAVNDDPIEMLQVLDDGWKQYLVPRYGVTIDLPGSLQVQDASQYLASPRYPYFFNDFDYIPGWQIFGEGEKNDSENYTVYYNTGVPGDGNYEKVLERRKIIGEYVLLGDGMQEINHPVTLSTSDEYPVTILGERATLVTTQDNDGDFQAYLLGTVRPDGVLEMDGQPTELYRSIVVLGIGESETEQEYADSRDYSVSIYISHKNIEDAKRITSSIKYFQDH